MPRGPKLDVHVGQCVTIGETMAQYKLNKSLQVWGISKPTLWYVVRLDRYRDEITLLSMNGDRKRAPLLPHCREQELTPAGKPDAIVVAEYRIDRGDENYWHFAIVVGKRAAIRAGCRQFKTTIAAVNHWAGRKRYVKAYRRNEVTTAFRRNGSPFNTPYYPTKEATRYREWDKRLNKWSLAFVRKVERLRAKN